LHMAQLMPLPLTVSCSSDIQIGFTFLAPAHLGSPRKGPLNVCRPSLYFSLPLYLVCNSVSYFQRCRGDGISIPIPTPHPYPWGSPCGSPWGSTYPRQTCVFHCRPPLYTQLSQTRFRALVRRWSLHSTVYTGSSHLSVVSLWGGVVKRRAGGAGRVGGANCECGR